TSVSLPRGRWSGSAGCTANWRATRASRRALPSARASRRTNPDQDGWAGSAYNPLRRGHCGPESDGASGLAGGESRLLSALEAVLIGKGGSGICLVARSHLAIRADGSNTVSPTAEKGRSNSHRLPPSTAARSQDSVGATSSLAPEARTWAH